MHASGMKSCDMVSYISFLGKVDPCLFISKTMICVAYVGDCLFGELKKMILIKS